MPWKSLDNFPRIRHDTLTPYTIIKLSYVFALLHRFLHHMFCPIVTLCIAYRIVHSVVDFHTLLIAMIVHDTPSADVT